MTTSSLTAIDSVLTQMRQVANAAASSSPSLGSAPASSGFAQELHASINRLAATQNHADTQANALVSGKSNVSLNDVMLDMQKANLAFQTSVQVRNRLVEAYKTISSMPV